VLNIAEKTCAAVARISREVVNVVIGAFRRFVPGGTQSYWNAQQ
jgi:hypothetical protein